MDMLLLISLIAVPVFLSLWTCRRLEEVLAPYLCGLMIALYGLSVFQALGMARLVLACALALCALGAVWRAARDGWKKAACRTAGLLLTPGVLCFAAASVFLVWCSRNHVVHSTDDIYYWAIEVRSLFAHGGLVDAAQHLSPRFMTYPPGLQLWQWIGLAVLGEWNEACLYAMLWVFYMSFVVSLMKNVTWKRGGDACCRFGWLRPSACPR